MPVQVLAGYWDYDLETRELLLCPRSRLMFGFNGTSQRQFSRFDWQPRIHPDDIATIECEIERAQRRDEVYSARFRTIRPDGSMCEVLGVGRATARDSKRFVGLNFEVTEAARKAVREFLEIDTMTAFAAAFAFGDGSANENDSWPRRARPRLRSGLLCNRQGKLDNERLRLCRLAQASLERRKLRKTFLKPTMFGEPAFDALLALYVQPASRMITAQALGVSIGANVPVLVRWLKFLRGEGLVLTVEDAQTEDPGAISAALTDKGRIALDEYLRATGVN